MSSTWQGPKVTLSVLGAAVNYLLTPWTQQRSWAHYNPGFLCVSRTEAYCKSGQRKEEIFFALEGMPLQFCMWHSKGKFLFLPPSSMQWSSLKLIPDLSFSLLEGKAAHPDSSVLPFQQVRPRGWHQNQNPSLECGRVVPVFSESPLLAESRHLDLGGCSHFSFSPCLLGPSGTFLISSLKIHQQWEIMNLCSVGGAWAVLWLNNWCK